MKILAFETSCDDTAISIVEDGVTVLSAVRISQCEHNNWGGVVPEIAARLHAENWKGAFEKCLKKANLGIKDIDFLATTYGPGLQTSLLTGTTASSFLSLLYQKPLIPVHHIYGHLCSVFLNRKVQDITFPAIGLTVSGGHTDLYFWRNATSLQRIGNTLDDACGEAFDKVAKMLGLGYPGGPIVSKYAEKGDEKSFDLPKIYLEKDSLDFSFSGLKAAVRRIIEKQTNSHDLDLSSFKKEDLEIFRANICASFQFTVGKIFLKKIERAFEKFPEAQSLYFVGGVSANTYLNKLFTEFMQRQCKTFKKPKTIEYSTDNASMIGAAAYFLYQQNPNIAKVQNIEPVPRLDLETFF